MADADSSLTDEAISLAIVLERLVRQYQANMSSRIAELRTALAALLMEHDFTEKDISDPEKASRRNSLVKAADKLIIEAMSEMASQHADDLLDVAELSQDSLSKEVAILIGILALSRKVIRTDLRELALEKTMIEGFTSLTWWGLESSDLRLRFDRLMMDSLVNRMPTQEVIQRIRGTRINGYADSLVNVTKRHATGLIRSAVHAVSNTVREEIGQRHPELFEFYKHLSILDSRTTLVCKSRANLKWYVADLKPIGHKLPFRLPPIHWACRSHMVLGFKQFADLPAGIRGRVKEEDFSKSPGDEPDLTQWIKDHPGFSATGAMEIDAARRKMGL